MVNGEKHSRTPEIVDGPSAHRPAFHLVGTHTIDDPFASAFLHATAHGVYEAFINGTRVGDLELTPGFNAYRKRLQVRRSRSPRAGRERRRRTSQNPRTLTGFFDQAPIDFLLTTMA